MNTVEFVLTVAMVWVWVWIWISSASQRNEAAFTDEIKERVEEVAHLTEKLRAALDAGHYRIEPAAESEVGGDEDPPENH